jgi:hypothetical protein
MSDAAPPLPRAAVLALAVLTVLAVAGLSLALFVGDIEDENGDDDSAAAATVTLPTSGDAFDRPDADGLADADHPWQEPEGLWLVQDSHAALSTGTSDDLPGLAVLPGDAPSSVEVTATAVEPGWGLAFRVQDRDNFWAVVADTDGAAWSLVHVADGTAEVTEGFVPVEPTDLAVVGVELTGDLIRVTVGDQSNQVSDPALADATAVGLVALPGGSLPSMAWDDLTITGN